MDEPKVFNFAVSPSIGAIDALINDQRAAGFDYMIVGYAGGDMRSITLSRFIESMPQGGTIVSLSFHRRGS